MKNTSPFKGLRDKQGYSGYKMAKELGIYPAEYYRLEDSMVGYRYCYYLFKALKKAKVSSFKEVEAMFEEKPVKIIKSLQNSRDLK